MKFSNRMECSLLLHYTTNYCPRLKNMQSKAKLCPNIKMYAGCASCEKKNMKFLETQACNVMSTLWCCQFQTVLLNYCLRLQVIRLSCAKCNPCVLTHGCTLHVQCMSSQTLLQQTCTGWIFYKQKKKSNHPKQNLKHFCYEFIRLALAKLHISILFHLHCYTSFNYPRLNNM